MSNYHLLILFLWRALIVTEGDSEGWNVSLVTQMVKNLPARQETWVRSPGREDPLEEGTATHSNIPAWRIPWTEDTRGLQSMGLQRTGHN